jgi:hypothetical protein
MNSNGNSFNRRSFLRPNARLGEDLLRCESLQVERKGFTLTLCENARGQFLRISEQGSGHSNAIIVPFSGLEQFQQLVADMAKAADELPPQTDPPSPSAQA